MKNATKFKCNAFTEVIFRYVKWMVKIIIYVNLVVLSNHVIKSLNDFSKNFIVSNFINTNHVVKCHPYICKTSCHISSLHMQIKMQNFILTYANRILIWHAYLCILNCNMSCLQMKIGLRYIILTYVNWVATCHLSIYKSSSNKSANMQISLCSFTI